jgi:tetratricopeptide (TPR) repeat protein
LASLLLRGREALEKQDLATAHADFQRAHALDTGHPAAMSYFGLTLTMVEHEHDKGLLLCEEAVKRAGAQPELLVNLGRACIAARQKRHAVKALTQASRLAPGDPRVEAAWAELGRRDRPVLPWFSRNFFLNRWLGRLRYRWRMRNAPPEEDAP